MLKCLAKCVLIKTVSVWIFWVLVAENKQPPSTKKPTEISKLGELFLESWKIKMLMSVQTLEVWLIKFQREI